VEGTTMTRQVGRVSSMVWRSIPWWRIGGSLVGVAAMLAVVGGSGPAAVAGLGAAEGHRPARQRGRGGGSRAHADGSSLGGCRRKA